MRTGHRGKKTPRIARRPGSASGDAINHHRCPCPCPCCSCHRRVVPPGAPAVVRAAVAAAGRAEQAPPAAAVAAGPAEPAPRAAAAVRCAAARSAAAIAPPCLVAHNAAVVAQVRCAGLCAGSAQARCVGPAARHVPVASGAGSRPLAMPVRPGCAVQTAPRGHSARQANCGRTLLARCCASPEPRVPQVSGARDPVPRTGTGRPDSAEHCAPHRAARNARTAAPRGPVHSASCARNCLSRSSAPCRPHCDRCPGQDARQPLDWPASDARRLRDSLVRWLAPRDSARHCHALAAAAAWLRCDRRPARARRLRLPPRRQARRGCAIGSSPTAAHCCAGSPVHVCRSAPDAPGARCAR